MSTDFGFSQCQGPFNANSNIIDGKYENWITHLGIQSIPGHFVEITCAPQKEQLTNQVSKIKIGKTGILQYENVRILGIKFEQDEPATTIVDFVAN